MSEYAEWVGELVIPVTTFDDPEPTEIDTLRFALATIMSAMDNVTADMQTLQRQVHEMDARQTHHERQPHVTVAREA